MSDTNSTDGVVLILVVIAIILFGIFAIGGVLGVNAGTKDTVNAIGRGDMIIITNNTATYTYKMRDK